MVLGSSSSRNFSRLRGEQGTGAGTVILFVGAVCITTWIFFAVVDWIVGVKEDRWARRAEGSQQQGPFVPKAPPGSQIKY